MDRPPKTFLESLLDTLPIVDDKAAQHGVGANGYEALDAVQIAAACQVTPCCWDQYSAVCNLTVAAKVVARHDCVCAGEGAARRDRKGAFEEELARTREDLATATVGARIQCSLKRSRVVGEIVCFGTCDSD